MSQNRKIVDEWIEKASEDDLSAEVILKGKEGSASTVCFLSQQMVEKYLKAFIAAKQNPPKIHQLDSLLFICMSIDSSFIKLKKYCILLNDYYIGTRYPGDFPDFSFAEADKAFLAATKIKNFVLSKLKQLK